MKERVKSIDLIRTISILAVMVIHTTTRTLEAAKYNLVGFPISIFLNQIGRFAVPIFFLISGFVLEFSWDESLNYFQFIKKRLSKIFIPFVFWSAIYYLFVYNQNHENFIQVLLKGDASYQLYFIPTLCIFYMAFPLLHKIYKIISNKFVMLLLLTSEIYLLYHDYFVNTFKYPDPVHVAILTYFFFVIGIVAARNKEKLLQFVRKWKYIIFSGTIVSGLYVFWEGRSRFLSSNNYFNFYSQWRPSVLVYSVLIGLTLFFVFEKKFQSNFFEKLSKLSFFVFFIHVAVLESFWMLIGKELFNRTSQSLIGRSIFDLLFFGVVAGISFLIAFIIHKISKLNKITG
jgi:surface polysaccharide O-acyltransferase-like enzyme